MNGVLRLQRCTRPSALDLLALFRRAAGLRPLPYASMYKAFGLEKCDNVKLKYSSVLAMKCKCGYTFDN